MWGRNFYVGVLKPVCDWLLAFFLLILISPFFLSVTLVLFIHFLRNPFFVHQRAGRNERPFYLLKFRTMKVDYEELSMTGLGKFMRSFSLDELPQLINVLKGDMSLVGPRPLLMEYLPYYNITERSRHNVKPGITGWGQVNGRNKIDWGERMRLDIYYVENISLSLDMKILIKTLVEVFKRDKTSYVQGKTIKFSEYAANR
ncbi:MAG: sugar transferase [Ekhidna sp.]|uniref:sugar transferase n=1 Tax=Ekhidna sp. TaxID=2608089 RepID=UPI0032EAA99A